MVTHRYFSSDRTPLCADVYESQAGPEAGQGGLLCLVHGYCEHRGRYHRTAADLSQAGYRVVVPDLRGHGESGGQRAHVLHFSEYLDDLDATLGSVAKDEKPVVVGHSMGGLVALLYALERPGRLRAIVLSSPFLGLKVAVPAWKRIVGQLASRVYPGLALPNEIDPALLSHDGAIGRAYAADPLVPKVATARWFTEAMAAQAAVRRRARLLQLPALVLHAGDDRIADPAASQEVFDALGSDDKVLTIYPGLYHEIFNEVERGRIIADLLSWLKGH